MRVDATGLDLADRCSFARIEDGGALRALVSRALVRSVREVRAALRQQAELLHDGATRTLVDADPAVACCIGPALLGARDAERADRVHHKEVFGPVATLLPCRDIGHAHHLVRRGQGSLVVSLYGADAPAQAATAVELADSQGRVHMISPAVATTQWGPGNAMPQSLHGGPGRAGVGEELGGL